MATPPSPPPPRSPPPLTPVPPSPPPPTSPSPPPPVQRPPPPSPSPPPPAPRPPPPPSPSPPPPASRPPPPSPSPPPPASRPPPPSPNPPPPRSSPPPPPPLLSPPPPPPTSPPPPLPSPPLLQSSPTPWAPPPTNSKTVPTGIMIGVGVGAVVVATALVSLLVICLYRIRKKNENITKPFRRQEPTPPHPIDIDHPQEPYVFAESRREWSPTPLLEPDDSPIQKPLPLPPRLFGRSITAHPLESSLTSKSHSFDFSTRTSDGAIDFVKGTTTIFTYAQLLAATNSFSLEYLLGRGGFGDVYSGWINDKEVAIKKLRSSGNQGEREFMAEVEIISRVHHKNLVGLVGYCIYEAERLLVYEFVPNQTLRFQLHEKTGSALSWRQRWKIAIGSAKGLAYLHDQCSEKIIHRDIKAENILLDYDYEPKIADFGLAKFQPRDQTHVSTRIMGTVGYIAPEFVSSSELTDKADVFSYGVVILELITGRPPVLPSKQTLVDWARPFLIEAMEDRNFEHLVDSRLGSRYEINEMSRLIKCAASAVRRTAEKRPSMTEIVRHLEGDVVFEKLDTVSLSPRLLGSRRSSYLNQFI